MRRGWRRFRRLPAPAQAGIGVAVLAVYTVALILLVSAGGSDKGGKRSLSGLEKDVSGAVRTAKLFQSEETDIPDFRRPHVTTIRCKNSDCDVVYTVAVPGRGRIMFQQLEMMRSIFDHTAAKKVTIRVERSLPSGPHASPPAEEETAGGLPLLKTTCDRSKLPKKLEFGSQKEGQAILARSCTVGGYNPGIQHGHAFGGKAGPADDNAQGGGDGGGGGGQ